MALIKPDRKHTKANLKVKLNQLLTARTAYKCAHIILHYCSMQCSTEQLWQSSLLSSRQSS